MSVPDVAARVVAVVAPGEPELLPAVTRAWLDGDLPVTGARSGRWLGGSIGIGIDPQLTSLLIYPLLVAGLGPLLEKSVTSGARRLRRHRPKAAAAVVLPQVTASIERAREACYRYSLDLGLGEARARLLADAVAGVLLQPAPAGDQLSTAPSDVASTAPTDG